MADLLLGFRFGVFFFAGGVIPNPVDIRFQKVSGLSAEVSLDTYAEGGENLYTHRLPTRIDYGNLVLERGMVVGSPLNIEFNLAMSMFEFLPSNVMVTLFGEPDDPTAGAGTGIPQAAWLFIRAFPVKWTTSPLDATSESVVIDTMELAYSRMQALRI